MLKTKTKRPHIGGNRKTTKRKLMDCLEDKSKLEKYLEELKLSFENANKDLYSEIGLLRSDIGDLKKDNQKLHIDNQQLHNDVGDLQANLIIANIVTSIQDINTRN